MNGKPRSRRRALKGLIAVTLALAVFLVVFDWNWLRGPVERYYAQKSGRDVKIGHLDVALGFSLLPTVKLRDVHIPNAPWGSERPFVSAREVRITFSIASVWRDRPVISRIALVDADVTLERQADGLRNWRLRHPENRGPGKTRVLVLETQQARVAFVNRASELEIVAAATPLPPGQQDARFNTRVTFEGRYRGAPFTGEALNGGVISFRESGLAFPVRGHLVSRKTRVELDGLLTDVFDLGPMDTAIRVAGPSLALLHPFVRVEPPASRPYDLRAHLTQRNDVYTFSKLAGKIGATDLAGEATFDRSGERSSVRAELSSRSADLVDLRALAGLRDVPDGGDAKGAGATGERFFPTRRFNVEKLRAVDAYVKLDAAKLSAADAPMIESLRGEARLAGGNLEVKPLDLGIAGGHALGSVAFDARGEIPTVRAALELKGLRLERLAPAVAEKTRSAGALRGRIELTGRGLSLAAALASANGSLAVQMDRGRISSLADAKLGLNFGKLLGALIRGDGDNAIHCGAALFDVRNAVAKSRTIVLDTEQTHVEGAGTIDLRNEQLDFLLTPVTRKPGLLTRRGSIRVQGPFRDVRVSVQDQPEPRGPARSGCNTGPA